MGSKWEAKGDAMKFTTDAIAALRAPTGKQDHIEWDSTLPGFGIRVRGKSKFWIVQYRVGPQQRRESLGDVRKVKLDDARKIARHRFAQAELGTDPAAERAKARSAAAATKLTLANVAARYLDAKRDVLRSSTYVRAERYFTVLFAPLKDQPIDSITRAAVAARLQDISKGHGRSAAHGARANLSALYNWAAREGLCDANPVSHTNDPSAGVKPRERVLSNHELVAVWKACEDDDFGRIVRLLVLTGCRREEIAALKWSEIDLANGVITIPGTRTKNHRTLALTLPPMALDILRSAPRRGDREFVFGKRGGSYGAWSYSTMALNGRILAAEGKALAHWTLHDLRRTYRTGLGKIGVPPHVAELCINHVKGGVQAVYDKHRYEGEIASALAQWAEHVAALIEGRKSKVVPLKTA
jgi:integrase